LHPSIIENKTRFIKIISKILNTELKDVKENSDIKIRKQYEINLMSLDEYLMSSKK
jgi:hypothetical protein